MGKISQRTGWIVAICADDGRSSAASGSATTGRYFRT
jgi:hypothetical protein